MKKRADLFLRTCFILFILAHSISVVNALGVTSFYFSGNPLEMSPGETKVVSLLLQNQEDINITVKGEILSDSKIARLVDEDKKYFLPSKIKNVKSYIEIKIPKEAEPEEEYEVFAEYTQVAQEGGEKGMIGFRRVMRGRILVKILGEKVIEPKKPVSAIWIILIVILCVIVISYTVIRSILKKRKALLYRT